MLRKKENFQFCVYLIFIKNYHKVYVGSTTRWPYRKSEHINDLKQNQHCNKYLQRAINKHGLRRLIITPLEFCVSETSLRLCEQKWIDYYQSAQRQHGFNLVRDATRPGTKGLKMPEKQRKHMSVKITERMRRREERDKISKTISDRIQKEGPTIYGGKFIAKTFILFSPTGKQTIIHNLCKFCRKHNLEYTKMYDLAVGKTVEYQGWKSDLLRINNRKKHYLFISPSGETIHIFGLAEFCRQNNLPTNSMNQLHHNRIKTCKGWRKG